MQVVSQELGAALPTVTVEYREELDLKLWLLVAVGLDARLLQIKDDRDPIFVVVAHEAVVSVCSVRDHVRDERPLRDFSLLDDRSPDLGHHDLLRRRWS